MIQFLYLSLAEIEEYIKEIKSEKVLMMNTG